MNRSLAITMLCIVTHSASAHIAPLPASIGVLALPGMVSTSVVAGVSKGVLLLKSEVYSQARRFLAKKAQPAINEATNQVSSFAKCSLECAGLIKPKEVNPSLWEKYGTMVSAGAAGFVIGGITVALLYRYLHSASNKNKKPAADNTVPRSAVAA